VTDMAVPVERVDEAKVEEERLLAEARLREQLSDEEMASVTTSLTRLLVQLQAKRRHRA